MHRPVYHPLLVLLGLVAVVHAAEEWNDQVPVDGYTGHGRGSCQDERGKMYSYLQRVMTFPNAETCAQQECERFAGAAAYRGFEFSVAKRCTCLFDVDTMPVVPNEEGAPEYASKKDGGMGAVTVSSKNPGTHCYQFGAGVKIGSLGVFYATAFAMALAFGVV